MQILFPLVLPFFLCDVVAGSIHRPRGLLRERVGGELNRKGDYSSDDTDDGATNGHEFPTAIHSPAAFGFDVDDASVNLDDIFTPAASLDVFKNIDPSKFEWVNPDNIEAGATTCGFLHPTLGAEPGVNYPVIDVYMCVHFATNQPAPKGNLVGHCGGPGALSGCGVSMGSAAGIEEENAANYNIISIDQRGMGRSQPSFNHEECVVSDEGLDPDEDGKMTAAGLQIYLDGLKEYVASCWGCSDCDFHFDNIDQPDGSVRTFHFLEYSGTRQLAEDLNRFRVLVEAPQLSLYGISYGTGVMATYATIFPRNVDKFITDSNQSPYNTVDYIAKSWGTGLAFRYNYLKYTCWAANAKIPGSCPVEPEDLADCIGSADLLMHFIQQYNDYRDDDSIEVDNDTVASFLELTFYYDPTVYNIALTAGSPVEFLLQLLTIDPETMGKVCTADKELQDQLEILIADFDSDSAKKRSVGLDRTNCNTYDQPSNVDEPVCFDAVPGVQVDFLVNGQDQAGGVSAYNDDVFISQVLEFQEEYGHEYLSPVYNYVTVGLSVNYYWPRNIPLPILGNPNVSGMISGQLYDSATPYLWTSQMREHFPSTSALTSQSINHGVNANVGGADGPCQSYIVNYLATGVIDWTDGTVCGDDYPYFNGDISRK